MDNNQRKEVLLDLGLGKNEVDAYLKLFELGPSTAARISKEAKIHRPNAYDAITKLSEKGLVSFCMIGGSKVYSANSSDSLMNLLKSREISVKTLLSELELSRINAQEPADVSIFEGVMGVRQALSEATSESGELLALCTPKEFPLLIGEGWLKEWHAERMKKKIWFHHIVNDDYVDHRVSLLDKMPYTSIRFSDKNNYAPLAILAYTKGVLIFTMSPLMGIRIKNETAAISFKQVFTVLQSSAKKPNAK